MKMSKVICDCCSKEFERENKTANYAKRNSLKQFCSKECLSRFYSKQITCHCGECGVEVMATPKRLKLSKTGKVFCSSKCSCAYRNKNHTKTQEEKQKISNSLKVRNVFFGVVVPKRTPRQIKIAIEKIKTTWKDKIMEADYSSLSFERLRKRIKYEQNECCNRCGISEWQGQKIALEVEHKDGNHNNNKRENLEALCPNCHSLTSTWRGRNKTPSPDRPVKKDIEIVEAFLKHGNIRQCLLSLGLAPKGSNYGRVKRVLTLNGIKYLNETV